MRIIELDYTGGYRTTAIRATLTNAANQATAISAVLRDDVITIEEGNLRWTQTVDQTRSGCPRETPDPPDPRDFEETEEDRERIYVAWPLTDSDDDSIPF